MLRLGASLIVEGVVAVFGLMAVWVIFALRDRPGQVAASPLQPTTGALPLTGA